MTYENNLILNSDGLLNQIVKRAKACAKIKVNETDVRKCVQGILDYIAYFNTIEENDIRILNREFEQIEIISEFKDFLTPKSVKYSASDPVSVDLLVRPKISDADALHFSYDEFINYEIEFRGYFKQDIKTNTVKLSQIKIDESLANIQSKVAIYDGKVNRVKYLTEPYIPIQIAAFVGQFHRPSYYNATVGEVVNDFVSRIIYG